jgi:hypothetical protein
VVEAAAPVRLQSRPGQREAIMGDPQVGEEPDVFPVPVIVVDGDVAGVAVLNLAGRVGERVPD